MATGEESHAEDLASMVKAKGWEVTQDLDVCKHGGHLSHH